MSKAHAITLVKTDSIVPNERNRNRHDENQINQLCKIIKYQGFRIPLIVSNLSGKLVSGHGRLLAAKQLGLQEVPVIYQDFEDAEQEFLAGVSDNAIASQAELDLPSIHVDIQEMGPFDLDLLGVKDFQFEPDPEIQGDADAVPETPKEAKTKRGELWFLGEHRLLIDDCTVKENVERLMGGEKADMVFTDPPYGVNYDGGHAVNGVRREKLANDENTQIYDEAIPQLFNFSKPTAALYLWFAATKSLQVLQVLHKNNYEIRSWLIWNKNVAQFGAIGAQYKQKHEPCLYCYKKGESPFWDGPNNEISVWDVDRSSKNEFHPTQKPVELSERAIGNSCPSRGVVLDLFLGSGSTIIACEKTRRRGFGTELEPLYGDVILQRFAKFSGKDPAREDGVKWSELNA